jgi:hypothetical protein
MAPHPAGPDGFDDRYEDPDDYEAVDIKEAFGLPDSLPPIRLPSLPELVALARQAPLARRLAEFADWIGEDGREATDDDLLAEPDAACEALGVTAGDLAYLWEYAHAVEWLTLEEDDEGRVRALPADTALDWAEGDDEEVFDAWSSTFAAVLSETLYVAGPPEGEDWTEIGLGDLDFDGQPMALAILLFLARREGLTVTDFTEVLWENASGDMPPGEAAAVRARWLASYGDPARLLLDKLADVHAITESGDTIRLTPLALAVLHEQLVEAGVVIPLLPPTAAELTGVQLLAMAEGVSDDEFEAESDAWVAERGADAGARILLSLAARAAPGERMLAVAAVTRIGAGAEPAWRESLDVPELRAYAKIALAALSGGEDMPPDLEPLPEDAAWVTTDMLAIACDEEFPDPDELAATFSEAVPAGQEAVVFDLMWRGSHPDVIEVLQHIGKHHPDKQVAKAARNAAHKATSRRASNR